eukprot:1562272-Heterocapsa_arctica.AAC.1
MSSATSGGAGSSGAGSSLSANICYRPGPRLGQRVEGAARSRGPVAALGPLGPRRREQRAPGRTTADPG